MKVSVIVPVYNVAPYLRQCLDSILGQTLRDMELICVDDGSTDGSLDILREYAGRDARMTVLTQEHQRAAAARNKGIELAKGDYLIFLDSDDFFDLSLLETMTARAEETNADVALCEGRFYNQSTGEYKPWGECLDVRALPKKDTFAIRELNWRGYLFTTTGPINKLIRRELILKNNLRFQDVLYANDLYIICLCMTLAQRVTACIGQPLVTYRVGMTTNTQSNTKSDPTAFSVALLALKNGLTERGLYAAYKAPFDCLVYRSVNSYLLNATSDPATFALLLNWLRSEGFRAFDADVRSIGAPFLCAYLATYEGVTRQTDTETARLRIIKNREKYQKAGIFSGHKIKRFLFMLTRLIARMGFIPGIKHALALMKG